MIWMMNREEVRRMVHMATFECPSCGNRQDHPGACDKCGAQTK